jgi:hypothetical protein
MAATMIDLLDDIQKALDAKAYYLALMGTLALPDLCAAMEHADGITSPERYETWFNTRVGAKYKGELTGEQCYQFRCSMLHDAAKSPHRYAQERIVFMIPGADLTGRRTMRANRVVYLNLDMFCHDVVIAVAGWLKVVKWTEPFETHVAKMVSVHSIEIFGATERLSMIG